MRHTLHLQTNQGAIILKEKPIWTRKDANLRVPDDGQIYVQIKHDWEVLGHPRQYEEGQTAKYPFPAVVNTKWGLLTSYNSRVYDYLDVPDDWQWFFWRFLDWASGYQLPRGEIIRFYTKPSNSGLFAECTPGSLMWVYVNMIEKSRSHTDAAAPEVGARDVVTGRNLESPKPWKWLARPTTGHVSVAYDAGTHWRLPALDLLKPPPTIEDVERNPSWYCWGTEITTTKLSNGRYVVSNYPQIEVAFRRLGLGVAGTPLPVISLGGSYLIKKSACRVLTPGASWSAYVP